MPAFIVRISSKSELPNAREFVGVVVAASSAELSDIVDEFTDPNLCEYALLPPGMIFARDDAPLIPDYWMLEDEEPGSESERDFWSGGSVSEDRNDIFKGRAEDGQAIWLQFEDISWSDGSRR